MVWHAQDGGPPQDLRFSPIHNDDHSGYLWILTILCMVYSFLTLVTRAHIKWGVYGLDDYLIAVATLAHLGQSVAVFYSLNEALGKFNSITNESQWFVSGRTFLASELLAILTLCLAKCSVVSLMLRLFTRDMRKYWIICAAMLAICAAWGLASIVGLVTECNGNTLLTTENVIDCPSQFARWQAITAIDIITDIGICLLPVALVWSLQMSLTLKAQVVVAFMFRVPLIVFSACHLAYFKDYPTSPEPQFAVTNTLVFQQAMLATSLLSATIPNLKAFMKSFSVGFGLSLGLDTGVYSSNNNYPLEDIKSAPHPNHPRTDYSSRQSPDFHLQSARSHRGHFRDESGVERDGIDGSKLVGKLRPDNNVHETTIYHSDRTSGTTQDKASIGSSGSQELIIKREVQWNVQYEPHHDSWGGRPGPL